MKPISIKVGTPCDGIIPAEVEYLEANDGYRITYTDNHSHWITTHATDLFEGLKTIRKELDALQYRVLCNAARKDVWPSSMSRDAGAAVLYITPIGSSAHGMVNIFAECAEELTATVDEQEEYHIDWLKSF